LTDTSATLERRKLKRSLTVAGHRTSMSLEPEFWQALKDLAIGRHTSVAALVAEIDRKRANRNLSSAIRVYVLKSLQSR
jgi:predicted DNA-binding ribbon-helix-helix protein